MSPRHLCFCWFFWVLYTLTLCFSLALIIFSLIFLPKEPKFVVANATLTQFNFTTLPSDGNIYRLRYNLTLNITIRNPNKRVGIYYRAIEATSYYRIRDQKLDSGILTPTPFYQGHKTTTLLNPLILQGETGPSFAEKDIPDLNSEIAAGVFSIDVELAVKVAVRFGNFKTRYYTPPLPNIIRELKLPLLTATAGGGFKATKCGNVQIIFHALSIGG